MWCLTPEAVGVRKAWTGVVGGGVVDWTANERVEVKRKRKPEPGTIKGRDRSPGESSLRLVYGPRNDDRWRLRVWGVTSPRSWNQEVFFRKERGKKGTHYTTKERKEGERGKITKISIPLVRNF